MASKASTASLPRKTGLSKASAAKAVKRPAAPRRTPPIATASAAPGPPPWMKIDEPSRRLLRVYALDPSAGNYVGNIMSIGIRWERNLKPGPVGRRFAVIDYDGANKCYYPPVDLNDYRILARGGLDPSESDPRFHQQMVYAVASETLEKFEAALGRNIHWRRADRPGRQCQENRRRCGAQGGRHLGPQAVSARDGPGQCVLQPRSPRHPVRLFPGRGHQSRATTCRASASSRACRTTSSRTRSRTPSSTGSGPSSPSRRTPTCWRSTRRSPT